jgi:hypothetical protein
MDISSLDMFVEEVREHLTRFALTTCSTSFTCWFSRLVSRFASSFMLASSPFPDRSEDTSSCASLFGARVNSATNCCKPVIVICTGVCVGTAPGFSFSFFDR